MKTILLGLSFYLVATIAAAECDAAHIDDGVLCRGVTLTGTIVHIADGDTVVLLDEKRVKHRLRLAFIDAPESTQAYGDIATQQMSSMCFQKDAKAAVVDIDHYGREVALLSCAGVNANESMVRAGMAWVYTQYAPKLTRWRALEIDARRNGYGLWATPSPMAPWDYRHKK